MTDGKDTISISNGASYQYLWSDMQTTQTAVGLAPGMHYVTATDVNGCILVDSALITAPTAMSLDVMMTDVSCNGGNDGSGTAIASGGTGNYQYMWSNGTPSNNINNLTAGTYFIISADENNCEVRDTIIINEPNAININIDNTYIDCNNSSSGSIDISVNGGAGNYTYAWSSGETTEDIDNLAPGTFQVTVTDDTSCTAVETISISEPAALQSSFDITDVDCFGESTGGIALNTSGGAAPYQYNWSDGSTDTEILDVIAGDYFLTITDANGCIFTDTVTINQPEGLIMGNVEFSDISCHGEQSGEITIEAEGGTAPYFYSVNGSDYQANNQFAGLAANEYIVFVQDINNCVASLPAIITLEEPDAIVVELGDNQTIALGESTTLTPEVSNAVGDLTYIWTSPDTSTISCLTCENPIVDTEKTLTYQLTVIDENGCTGTDYITIYVERLENIIVPTGFSPNNDGFNDMLHVHGKTNNVNAIITFRIFDRWGEVVYEYNNFQPNDLTIGWDGTYRGKEMNSGTFVWYLEAEFIDGSKETFKGQTNLLR